MKCEFCNSNTATETFYESPESPTSGAVSICNHCSQEQDATYNGFSCPK